VYPPGKIVTDRPFLALACRINPLTTVRNVGAYVCSDEQHYTFKWLREWPGYHGCNESTQGYNGHGGIEGLSNCGMIRLI
ncbi:MAG: hypothetical protein ABIF10_05575, partial [Candidatus Woesearchaeota archaeon]